MTSPSANVPLSHRVFHCLYSCATIFVAIILCIVHLMSWAAAMPILLVAALFDLNRSKFISRIFAKREDFNRTRSIPFRFYISPRHIFYIIGLSGTAISIGYFVFTGHCWDSVIDWSRENVWSIDWRFRGIDVCQFSRGGYLVSIQYPLLMMFVVISALFFNSQTLRPRKFSKENWKNLINKNNLANINIVNIITLVFSIYIFALFPFSFGVNCISRCIRQELYFSHFILWFLSYIMPLIFVNAFCVNNDGYVLARGGSPYDRRSIQ